MAEPDKKKKAKAQRASNNELDLMKEIITEHHGLYLRVLDILRNNRNRDSIFDVAMAKQRKLSNKTES